MSYWSIAPEKDIIRQYSRNDALPYDLDMVRTSVESFSKAYGSVHLITDKEGEKKLSFIDWDTVSTDLEVLPKEYHSTWSLGKLKAYNIIAQRGEPFLHVDSDFFINGRLPKEIEESEILFQNTEFVSPVNNYVSDLFRRYCTKKYLTANSNPILLGDIENNYKILNRSGKLTNVAYNCGIAGGSDLEYFFQYSKCAIDTVLDEANKHLWTQDQNSLKKLNINTRPWSLRPWSLAITAEQYFADIVAFNTGKQAKFLTSDFNLERDIEYWLDEENTNFKWLHLLGHYKLYYNDIFKHKIFIPDKYI